MDIYEMKLHDIVIIGNVQIIRVAGGWIYNFQKNGGEVFIPFNNEFQNKNKINEEN